jgi:DNA-directed RNA polymerase beta' subunit
LKHGGDNLEDDLSIPPPPVCPSIAVDGGAMWSEDDLIYKLGDIIKASANASKKALLHTLSPNLSNFYR